MVRGGRGWLALVVLAGVLITGGAGGASQSSSHAPAHDVTARLPETLRNWPSNVAGPRFSPDGTHIGFASTIDGNSDIWVMEASTGDARRLTDTRFNETRPAWSPDGRQIVYASDRDGAANLWIVDVADGASRRVTTSEHVEGSPHWSPRGDLITYVSNAAGNWDVWVVAPDGTGARQVTTHEGNEYHPKFSPDGSQIVFYPTWSGWTDIYIVDVADGKVTEILSSDDEDFRPAFSPDGKYIAFATDRGVTDALWLVPAAGGEPFPIFESDANVDFPYWSSDGATIMYLGEERRTRLMTVDLDIVQRRPLGPPHRALDRYPDVSPDGALVAFESSRFGNEGNVVLLDPATGSERRVTAGRINDGSPRFSNDGRRLVFGQSGGDWVSEQAMVVELPDGEPKPWSERRNVAFPVFCGERSIAFEWSEMSYSGGYQLWIADAEGNERRLGDIEVERAGIDCSDDGTWLVASLYQSGSSGAVSPRLVRVDVATGEVTVLTRADTQHWHPRISPDGRVIAFVADTGGGSAAFVVDATGGEPRQIIEPGGVAALAWSGPTSLVYTEESRRETARLIAVPDSLRR